MRRHRAPDLRLLADDHALQDARVAEAESAGDGCVRAGEGGVAEGGGEGVEGVADFVDGSGGWFE